MPSSNADTGTAELSNVEAWAPARRNNWELNQTKSVEVIFTGRKRRQQALPPAPLPGIARVSSVKILGVTMSSIVSQCRSTSPMLSTHVRKRCTTHFASARHE